MFLRDFSLKPLNTFGLEARAKLFAAFCTADELGQLLASNEFAQADKRLILGGGSNILFTGDYHGLVLHNQLKGLQFVEEPGGTVLVKAAAGERWHDVVLATVERDLGGLENMSLIPGTIGAAPIQNIGAYGKELKDVFVSLLATDLSTGTAVEFRQNECIFGYRDSIFKNKAKGKYLITEVTLRLNKAQNHRLDLSYGAISHTLQEMEVGMPSIADVSKAVIRIRTSKLPDPAKIGNAGSFFKNPEIAAGLCEQLLERYPTLPYYNGSANGHKKIAAGWLIEQCGWKGKAMGNAQVNPLQALVLTNPGNATGQEVLALASAIQASVADKFGIELETEVNIL